VLQREVAQSADAEHGDRIGRATRVTLILNGGHTRAGQRSGVLAGDNVGHRGEGRRHDGVLGEGAVDE
jgi:hypothetical protein